MSRLEQDTHQKSEFAAYLDRLPAEERLAIKRAARAYWAERDYFAEERTFNECMRGYAEEPSYGDRN